MTKGFEKPDRAGGPTAAKGRVQGGSKRDSRAEPPAGPPKPGQPREGSRNSSPKRTPKAPSKAPLYAAPEAAPEAPPAVPSPQEAGFTHIDETGAARMVEVSDKSVTRRQAVARGEIWLGPAITEAVAAQAVKKGDVLGVARVAGIMAAKNTPNAIPLCHPLSLTGCGIDFHLDREAGRLTAVCRVSTDGKTGVEMEALSGVAGALLAVYDMCKAIDKGMVIGPVALVEKSGGKSGTWRAAGPPDDRDD